MSQVFNNYSDKTWIAIIFHILFLFFFNSFRNLVPGLPSKFYYKLEPSSLSSSYPSSVLNKDVEFRRKPKLYHDHRQMLSSEDWYHIPSGQLDLDEKLNVDSFTDLNAQFYP